MRYSHYTSCFEPTTTIFPTSNADSNIYSNSNPIGGKLLTTLNSGGEHTQMLPLGCWT